MAELNVVLWGGRFDGKVLRHVTGEPRAICVADSAPGVLSSGELYEFAGWADCGGRYVYRWLGARTGTPGHG